MEGKAGGLNMKTKRGTRGREGTEGEGKKEGEGL